MASCGARCVTFSLLTIKTGLIGDLALQKSRLVIADDDLNCLNLAAAGFAHADAADLFGDVVLSADNFEPTAAADGADEAAFAGGSFVVAVECVG